MADLRQELERLKLQIVQQNQSLSVVGSPEPAFQQTQNSKKSRQRISGLSNGNLESEGLMNLSLSNDQV